MRYHLCIWDQYSPGVPPHLEQDVTVEVSDDIALRQRSEIGNTLLVQILQQNHLDQAARVVFTYYSSNGEHLGGKVCEHISKNKWQKAGEKD